MDVEAFFALDSSSLRLMLKTSKISHDDCRSELFGAQPFGEEELQGIYYGSSVFPNLTRECHRSKTHNEEEMQVTVHTFRK